jgi:hypothetical protein
MPERTPQDWEDLEQELYAAAWTPPRSRPAHVACSPKPAAPSSPRCASNST